MGMSGRCAFERATRRVQGRPFELRFNFSRIQEP